MWRKPSALFGLYISADILKSVCFTLRSNIDLLCLYHAVSLL